MTLARKLVAWRSEQQLHGQVETERFCYHVVIQPNDGSYHWMESISVGNTCFDNLKQCLDILRNT